MAHLDLQEPTGDRTVPLEGSVVVVGASQTCDVVLADAGVSAEHCELRSEPGGWRIVDLESRSGTRVNGSYVNQRALADGDEIELGITKLTLRASTAAALPPAPAGPAAVAAVQVPRPPRKQAPAQAGRSAAPARKRRGARDEPPARGARRGGGRRAAPPPEHDDEPEERPRRRRKKRSDGPVITLLAIGGLIVLGVFIWLAVKPESSINRDIVKRMQEAERRTDWQGMVDAAAGADPLDQYEYQRIQEMKATAEQGLSSLERGDRIGAATKAWNQVILHHQSHFKDTDGFVTRIDIFLKEFGDLNCVPVADAKKRRVALTGELGGDAPASGDAAWTQLKQTLNLLGKSGRWKEAFEKLDAFQKQSGTGVAYADISTFRAELDKGAKRWFGLQLSRADMKAQQGDLFNARKILQKAADGLGTEEASERATKRLRELEDAAGK